MKKYIGTKFVSGEPMWESVFLATIKGTTMDYKDINRQGYKVVYDNGYVSWSPKEVFEAAYRELTELEINFMSRNPDQERA